MKLHKKLSIGGKALPLIDETVHLGLFTPGRAVFTVEAVTPLTGVVQFSCGYQINHLQRWFLGYVESSTQVGAKQLRVFCRELTAVLHRRLPLMLRDVTLEDTLTTISGLTALSFVVPEKALLYTRRPLPVFYNLANGYYAMDSLAKVYHYTQPLWQQQVDGKVFVGSWADSRWPARPVVLPQHWESSVTSANGAAVPALPALRPGALYNGAILTTVALTGLNMALTWAENPWAGR